MEGELPGPLRTTWLHDVLAVPNHACLYDRDGQRIDATMHLHEGRPLRRVTPVIAPPVKLERVDEPVVYAGHLPKHFGHFLLESLSRTWVYPELQVGPLPLLHLRQRFNVHEQPLLEALIRPFGARLLPVERPTLLRSVLVPEQGIEIGRDYHPTMRRVYDAIRDELIGSEVTPDDTPLYLSRTRLPRGRRATLGEHRLEARLERAGVRILHPQELPLADQIRTVAGARTVIGLPGTALHLTLFRSLADARTISLDTRMTHINQVRVDRLRGARHEHLRIQYPIHPRVSGLFDGRELPIGPYRNLVIPPSAERAILSIL